MLEQKISCSDRQKSRVFEAAAVSRQALSTSCREKKQHAADLEEQAENGPWSRNLSERKHTAALYAERLDGMSPLKKLQQGYSYIEDETGRALTGISQTAPGKMLKIHLADGVVAAEDDCGICVRFGQKGIRWQRRWKLNSVWKTAFDQIEQFLLEQLQDRGGFSGGILSALYEQGMKLLKKCSENIDHVEKQMLQIDEEGHTHEFS